jgi:hypothetical protein
MPRRNPAGTGHDEADEADGEIFCISDAIEPLDSKASAIEHVLTAVPSEADLNPPKMI